ncbi:hypothetical protein JD844_003673 [Phrynosoma platyrhinos]|uniref:MINDY4 N-terminal dimerisation domain-containing protein n=1 Tax=Phrynosoma platyrhinos TaxID=52577 RepID=A0ABQ7TD26_PHRPL|nr:hypothetical protein JD844_003673 [Phrynosoma platyrhinos]
MENALVEEVAASLVREFLSKKGLKKTSSTMDEEFPCTALSINNRNELRNILHLQSLYKMNKAKENPLKTILEIMTNYFLEHRSSIKGIKGNPSVLQNKLSQPRGTENFIFKKSLHDEATCELPEKNKAETYRYETDEETIHPAGLLGQHLPRKSEQSKPDEVPSSSSLTLEEKKPVHHCEDFQTTEPSLETRTTMREKRQAKPGSLLARGMLSSLTDISQEDSSKRRHLKRLSGITSVAHHGEEGGTKGSLPTDDSQENRRIPRDPPSLLSSHSPTSLDVSKDRSSKVPCDPHANAGDEAAQNSASSRGELFANLMSERRQLEERKHMSNYDTKINKKSSRLNFFQRQISTGSEKRERLPKNSDCR